jgi:hypothetical protein
MGAVDWEGITMALNENADLPVALAWAAVPNGENQGLLAISVRASEEVQRWTYDYDRLVIVTETLTGRDVAARLAAGQVTDANQGPFTFAVPQPNTGITYWYTSGLDVGMFGPYATPCLYFSAQITGAIDRVQRARLDDSVSGRGQPYYPTARDALLEILFGITRDQGRRDVSGEIIVRLPYRHGHLSDVTYVEDSGLHIVLGETDRGRLDGHELQVAWKQARTDFKLSRHRSEVKEPGDYIVPLDAEPTYAAVALMNANGAVVDSRERSGQPSPYPVYEHPLPPQAVPEAFDFLNSAWRNVFGGPLLRVRQMAEVAGLAIEVQSRSDFESRLSYLADIMKSFEIDDAWIEPGKATQLQAGATVDRLESALKTKLTGADLATTQAAISILRDTNRMRVALQHGKVSTDLATLAARLSLPQPPQWPEMWETLRYRLADALSAIRRALLSTL